jgi:predicted dehydrogenase
MANLSVHGRAPAASNRLTLIGTRGTIELEGDLLRCAGEQPCELRFDMAAGYLQSYAATIMHFVDCLRDGRVFETAPTDNLRTLGLVEAIYAPAAARVEDC